VVKTASILINYFNTNSVTFGWWKGSHWYFCKQKWS